MRKTSGAWDSELGVCDRGSRGAKLLSNSAACRWKRSSARDPRETFTLLLLPFDLSAASREKLHTWIHLAQVSFKAQGQLAIAFKECLVRRALPIRLMKAVSLSLDWNWSCRFPS